MPVVTALEAKNRFSQLLDRVVRGEEVVITRHEKPVARLVPEARSAINNVQEVVARLHALRRSMAKRRGFRPVSKVEIRKGINEGRP
jgi:prevent-host-death family protein